MRKRGRGILIPFRSCKSCGEVKARELFAFHKPSPGQTGRPKNFCLVCEKQRVFSYQNEFCNKKKPAKGKGFDAEMFLRFMKGEFYVCGDRDEE